MSDFVEEGGEKMNIPSVSVDGAGAETLTSVLPSEILLHIFRFLPYDSLINAEQVCCRWKSVVETCFASEKRLDVGLSFPYNESFNCPLDGLKRYGSSIQTLRLMWDEECEQRKFDWAKEIADRFPHLITVELLGLPISDDDFKYLSNKCCQLKKVSFSFCRFTAEGLRIFLQALPGIKYLKNLTLDDMPERSFRENSLADVSAAFSTCRNLEAFQMWGAVDISDTDCFSKFCKECVTLRALAIRDSYWPAEMFDEIQHCSLLEELALENCPNVDDSTLIQISNGCPNLRSVCLYELQRVTDEGLKCFATCRHLSIFETSNDKMTDETLVELSEWVNLREVKMWKCPLVSDRGCAALLAQCPRLQSLDVNQCDGVGDSIVASAIDAVESRQNGLVLQLMLSGRSFTPQSYNDCHPLLRIEYGLCI